MEVIVTGESGLLVILATGQRRGPGCVTILLHSMEDPHVLVKLLNLHPVQVNNIYNPNNHYLKISPPPPSLRLSLLEGGLFEIITFEHHSMDF